ncbi:hypothetical protein [Nocardia camponoti]|uniref:Uncharacterized protein n=1 Tax=Nocardia camponoti TaxID=1616106 RepID=A0A917QRF6_9NOCA|nr:hypothetical protein [Nocardia camponoti]GGK64905.1 hypothetical protein GCM10011591_41460 [Nocardia camponoti]
MSAESTRSGEFVLAGTDQRVLAHHMAFYGLGDILDAFNDDTITLRWTNGKPSIVGATISAESVESAVRQHLSQSERWTTHASGSEQRGTMSPRLSAFKTDEAWVLHQHNREEVLDDLTDASAWDDLRYLAALGEPSYWRFTPKRELLQDAGASKFEMQPRNRGSEFVGNRLRRLNERLPARKQGQIAAGIAGQLVIDELDGKPNGVTATGLTTPGVFDNALAWCALWGIGQFPLALHAGKNAVTSGHLAGQQRKEWFYVPVWEGPWRMARLRSVLASAQLHDAAVAGIPELDIDDLGRSTARSWLRARGIVGIVRFPIARFGSENAPERRALYGDPIAL